MSSTSIFDTVKAFRDVINSQARSKMPRILQYDTKMRELRPWLWPVYADGERVRPEDLSAHRKTHNFYAPSCLCTVLDETTIGRKEAEFYIDEDGSCRIACANNRCGYSVYDIERMYIEPMLPVRRYGEQEDDLDEDRRRHPKASENARKGPIAYGGVPLAYKNPRNRPQTTFGLLMQLDDPSFPGVPDDVFSSMFTQCKGCHWLMTTAAFPRHACLVPPEQKEVVIDLTMDSDDSDEEDGEAV